MKNSILIAVVFVAGMFTANAQTTNNGQVNVNINLHKFQTLTINQSDVNIDFITEDHYTNGATSGVIQDQITVSSTGAFAVKATSVTAMQNANGKQLGTGTSALRVSASAGTNPLEHSPGYANNTELKEDAVLFSADKGQFGKNVSVEYQADQNLFTNLGLINNEFVNQNDNKTTYQVQVVYTIDVK